MSVYLFGIFAFRLIVRWKLVFDDLFMVRPIVVAMSIAITIFCIFIVISIIKSNFYSHIQVLFCFSIDTDSFAARIWICDFFLFPIDVHLLLGQRSQINCKPTQIKSYKLFSRVVFFILGFTERYNLDVIMCHAVVYIPIGTAKRHCAYAESHTEWMLPHHWPIV